MRRILFIFLFALNARAENFRPGVLLVQYETGPLQTVQVQPGSEQGELARVRAEPGVRFAELDRVLTRQFQPSDPKVTEQWHHAKLRSTNAWAISVGYSGARKPLVQLAILDTPFQMNHPDLQANSALGWSMVRGAPNPFETNGFYHSTIAAGVAGAVLNNGVGVAGMVNCVLTPIDIGDQPTVSDMYDAIVWAADQGIRVVNLSWDGAFSETINQAGAYLKEKARGMLFMAGVNGNRRLSYPALPHIYAVSMTDQEDNARSASGAHIDFAAPGWEIFSTAQGSSYASDSGTSYSAPMVAGIAAWIMSAAPELGPDEIEAILKEGSVDLGEPGWDEQFGWGRIDFARVAQAAFRRSPISRVMTSAPGTVEAVYEPGTEYRLYRGLNLADWQLVTNATSEIVAGKIRLQDPAPGARAFYRIQIIRPR